MQGQIIKCFCPPPINRREIYRYLGCGEQTDELERLIDEAISICERYARYDVVYSEYPISFLSDGQTDLGFASVYSCDLINNLCGCESIVLFAATVGLEIDRAIVKYGKLRPSLAVCIQAVAAERIEALCNAFCDSLVDMGYKLKPRFSPGYGDLSLSVQQQIFSALNCPKNIGLTLNESLLMSPTKSVTAIVGVRSKR